MTTINTSWTGWPGASRTRTSSNINHLQEIEMTIEEFKERAEIAADEGDADAITLLCQEWLDQVEAEFGEEQ